MSDVSNGPGWWIASDGRWYPPELHPSALAPQHSETQTPAHAGTSGAGPVPGQRHVGPQLPNLFQEALHGTSLADNITVRFDGADERRRAEVRSSAGRDGPGHTGRNPGDDFFSASAPARPATTSAVATKRRWRKG